MTFSDVSGLYAYLGVGPVGALSILGVEPDSSIVGEFEALVATAVLSEIAQSIDNSSVVETVGGVSVTASAEGYDAGISLQGLAIQ